MPANKKAAALAAARAKLNTLLQQVYGAGEKVPVFGDGNPDAAVALVGEAPGEQETLQGKPFVGKAGQNLDEFLLVLGIVREDIYITNVVKFRPVKVHPRTGSFSNRPPDREEIELCRSCLLSELTAVSPQVVVTLGNVALKTLLDDRRAVIGDLHGQCVPAVLNGQEAVLFPLYHPASIIYNRTLGDTYHEDLLKLKGYLQTLGVV